MENQQTKQPDVKPKTSKLAIASLIVPVVAWIFAVFYIDIVAHEAYYGKGTHYLSFLANSFFAFPPEALSRAYLLTILISILLSIVAFVKIKKSKGSLIGRRQAVEGFLFSLTIMLLKYLPVYLVHYWFT